MLDRLTVDDFTPALGDRFTLDLGEGRTLELELVEAATHQPDLAPADADGVRTPFRLRFSGPAEPLLAQQIVPLEHERIGRLEIFMVPLGVDDAGATYEAIFA